MEVIPFCFFTDGKQGKVCKLVFLQVHDLQTVYYLSTFPESDLLIKYDFSNVIVYL